MTNTSGLWRDVPNGADTAERSKKRPLALCILPSLCDMIGDCCSSTWPGHYLWVVCKHKQGILYRALW